MENSIEIKVHEEVMEFIATLPKNTIAEIYTAFQMLQKFPKMYEKLPWFEGRMIRFQYFSFYYVYREDIGKIAISDYKFHREKSFKNMWEHFL